jgi:hypothetical protein
MMKSVLLAAFGSLLAVGSAAACSGDIAGKQSVKPSETSTVATISVPSDKK